MKIIINNIYIKNNDKLLNILKNKYNNDEIIFLNENQDIKLNIGYKSIINEARNKLKHILKEKNILYIIIENGIGNFIDNNDSKMNSNYLMLFYTLGIYNNKEMSSFSTTVPLNINMAKKSILSNKHMFNEIKNNDPCYEICNIDSSDILINSIDIIIKNIKK